MDKEDQMEAMLRMTGLHSMIEDVDNVDIINPTAGGSSMDVVKSYMEMLECQQIEDLVSVYLPDFVLFKFSMKSVLPDSMNCTFDKSIASALL